ncbi:MAG: hypothetical protein FWC13_05250 [Oscillospiraceae bacterium]|nr:hypothetical protein [Oscillospiraceae bacterium]
MSKTAYCKYCGKMIDFMKTKSGKKMPVNLPGVYYFPWIHGRDKLVLPSGEVIRCEVKTEATESGNKGYIPHFVTCSRYKKDHVPKKPNNRSIAFNQMTML